MNTRDISRFCRLPPYLYLADLFRGRRVLEVGSGAGYGAYWLATAGGASQVLGLESSTEAVDNARAKHRAANLEFQVANFGSLELPDGGFDVVCVPRGAALARWIGFLEEARRVLDRQGLLVLTATSADRAGAPGGIAYDELQSRLEPLFGRVRVSGLGAFVGLSLVEYSSGGDDDAPELLLDTTLTRGLTVSGGIPGDTDANSTDEVMEYVAVAGPYRGAPLPYAVFQMGAQEGILALRDAGMELPLGGGEDMAYGRLRARVKEIEESVAPKVARASETKKPEVAQAKSDARDAKSEQRESDLRNAVSEQASRILDMEAQLSQLRREKKEFEQRPVAPVSAPVVAKVAAPSASVAEAVTKRLRDIEEELAKQVAENQSLKWQVDEVSRAARANVRPAAAARAVVSLGASDDAPVASASAAEQFERLAHVALLHEQAMAQATAAQDERDAYIEELEAEMRILRARLDELTTAENRAGEQLRSSDAELRDARRRAAVAEGQLLKLHLDSSVPGHVLAAQAARAAETAAAATVSSNVVAPAPANGSTSSNLNGNGSAHGPGRSAAGAPDKKTLAEVSRLAELERAVDRANQGWQQTRAQAESLALETASLRRELAAREAALNEANQTLRHTMEERRGVAAELMELRSKGARGGVGIDAQAVLAELREDVDAATRKLRVDIMEVVGAPGGETSADPLQTAHDEVKAARTEVERLKRQLSAYKSAGPDTDAADEALEEIDELMAIAAAGLRDQEFRLQGMAETLDRLAREAPAAGGMSTQDQRSRQRVLDLVDKIRATRDQIWGRSPVEVATILDRLLTEARTLTQLE